VFAMTALCKILPIRSVIGNVGSETLRRTYDTKTPTGLSISVTLPSESTTDSMDYNFTANAKDDSPLITYMWFIDDKQLTDAAQKGQNLIGSVADVGLHSVYFKVRDAAGNWSDASAKWEWTVTAPVQTDVDFGGGVTVAVDPVTGETNTVAFTAVEFTLGSECTFTMSGFDATEETISNLTLYLVVSESLDVPFDDCERVQVEADAQYNTVDKELTVTIELPTAETESWSSFFVRGVDNKAD